MSRLLGAALLGAGLLVTSSASAQAFTFDPPGQLVPSSSGRGRVDGKVYAPTMRFPMESSKAFANSQVYGRGGGSGPGGGQCDTANYSYPWHDNYCESRSWTMPLCPGGTGHQGQDIRPGTCLDNVHWVVAAENGTITSVGSYSVYLTTSDGTRFDYLHMGSVQVKAGDRVTRGQRIGKVSNVFGGTPTTIHLHFNVRQTVAGVGAVYVPPYLSLVEAYKRLLNPGLPIPDAGASDAARDGGASDGAMPPDEPEPPPSPEDVVPSSQPLPDAQPGEGLVPGEANESGCAVGGRSSPVGPGALGLGLLALAAWRRRTPRRR